MYRSKCRSKDRYSWANLFDIQCPSVNFYFIFLVTSNLKSSVELGDKNWFIIFEIKYYASYRLLSYWKCMVNLANWLAKYWNWSENGQWLTVNSSSTQPQPPGHPPLIIATCDTFQNAHNYVPCSCTVHCQNHCKSLQSTLPEFTAMVSRNGVTLFLLHKYGFMA